MHAKLIRDYFGCPQSTFLQKGEVGGKIGNKNLLIKMKFNLKLGIALEFFTISFTPTNNLNETLRTPLPGFFNL